MCTINSILSQIYTKKPAQFVYLMFHFHIFKSLRSRQRLRSLSLLFKEISTNITIFSYFTIQFCNANKHLIKRNKYFYTFIYIYIHLYIQVFFKEKGKKTRRHKINNRHQHKDKQMFGKIVSKKETFLQIQVEPCKEGGMRSCVQLHPIRTQVYLAEPCSNPGIFSGTLLESRYIQWNPVLTQVYLAEACSKPGIVSRTLFEPRYIQQNPARTQVQLAEPCSNPGIVSRTLLEPR